MADEIKIPISSKYDDKGAKQALKDAKELDKLKPELKVTADVKAADRDISGLMKKVDLLDGEAATILLASNATDIASDIAGLIGDLDKLDASDPEVQVKADQINSLKGDLDTIEAKVREVNSTSVNVDVKADQIGSLKGDLDQVDAKLRETADQADTTAHHLDRVGGGGEGLKTRGNAISDLTGPLGDASSAASDFAGVFDGLGDIAEDVVGKLGVSEKTATAVSSAIGGLGIAVAAGAALWSVWSSRAKKAADDQKKLIEGQKKLNEAMSTGDVDKSSQAFVDSYGKVMTAAQQTGANIFELTKFITGQANTMPAWQNAIDATNASLADGSIQQTVYTANTKKAQDAVTAARQAYIDANGALGEQDSTLGSVNLAMQDVVDTSAALNQAYKDAADPTGAFEAVQQDMADTTDRVNQLLHDQADALNEQVDAALAAADSSVAMADAQQDFIDAAHGSVGAEKALADAQKHHGKSSKEAADANRDLQDAVKSERKAAVDAAAAAVRLAQDNATAGGKTLTAKQKIDTFNDSLLHNARFATPAARNAISDYIIKANNIPASKATEIRAAIAAGDIPRVESILHSTASKTRVAAIQADATNTAATGNELDNVANPGGNPRVAIINVKYGGELGPIGGIRDRGGFVGPDGALVAERRPEFVRFPGSASEVLVTDPMLVPPGTQVTSGAETERILHRHSHGGPVTNVTVNVPRGYHGNVLEDARKAARRSGGLYMRNKR